MTQYAVYAGLVVAGWLVRHWFPQLGGGGATPPPATPLAIPVTPTLPLTPALPVSGIQIGHGELLNLILAALQQVPTTIKPPTPPAAAVIVKSTM